MCHNIFKSLLACCSRFREWWSVVGASRRIFWSRRRLCRCCWMMMKWNGNVSSLIVCIVIQHSVELLLRITAVLRNYQLPAVQTQFSFLVLLGFADLLTRIVDTALKTVDIIWVFWLTASQVLSCSSDCSVFKIFDSTRTTHVPCLVKFTWVNWWQIRKYIRYLLYWNGKLISNASCCDVCQMHWTGVITGCLLLCFCDSTTEAGGETTERRALQGERPRAETCTVVKKGNIAL